MHQVTAREQLLLLRSLLRGLLGNLLGSLLSDLLRSLLSYGLGLRGGLLLGFGHVIYLAIE